MTDEEIVAALAQALPCSYFRCDRGAALRALLPVVRRVAEQRAAEELRAEELRAAAEDWDSCCKFGVIARRHLRARAAALTATPNHGRSAT